MLRYDVILGQTKAGRMLDYVNRQGEMFGLQTGKTK